MAILGYNTAGPSTAGLNTGDKGLSKWTLAAPQTLTELHGYVVSGSPGGSVIWCVYSDVAGTPTTRLAFTSPLTVPGTGLTTDLSETGLSVALAAGDYWIGYTCGATVGSIYLDTAGGTSNRWSGTTTFNPPATPCEGGATAGARRYAVWAVVGAAPSTFVPQVLLPIS